MIKLNNYLLIISLVVLVVAFFKRHEFPPGLELLPELQQAPLQTPIDPTTFQVEFNDENFLIKPKFQYELFGLVVSYRLHDSESGWMLHALNKDHINVADYCVVWQDAANPEILREFDFSNGQFTCNYSTRSHQAWEAFNQHQLSNNHLLAIDPVVRKNIDRIKIGDQIHIKGALANYIGPSGYERPTSVVRTDTGNGACETIWVEELTILSSMNSLWRDLIWLSLGVLILTAYIYIKSPVQAPR